MSGERNREWWKFWEWGQNRNDVTDPAPAPLSLNITIPATIPANGTPELIALQQQLSEAGLYASEGKRYYNDGVFGELTQHGINLAQNPDFAKTHLSSILTTNVHEDNDVRMMQASLNRALGLSGENLLIVDGEFGPKTAEALMDYLELNPELKDTLNPALLRRLDIYVEDSRLSNYLGEEKYREVNQGKTIPAAGTSNTGDNIVLSGGIDNNAIRPLLDFIAEPESGGNYNAAYGHSGGIRGVDFTSMTVNEVLAWQRDYVNSGSPSSAVGRYQIIRGTMEGLVDEMGLTGNERFTPELQDRMAMVLLERRGLSGYLSGEISEDRFMRNLSQEWASLPRDNSGRSYYAGDGLNRAHVTPTEVRSTLREVRLAAADSPDSGATRVAAASAPSTDPRAVAATGGFQTAAPRTNVVADLGNAFDGVRRDVGTWWNRTFGGGEQAPTVTASRPTAAATFNA